MKNPSFMDLKINGTYVSERWLFHINGILRTVYNKRIRMKCNMKANHVGFSLTVEKRLRWFFVSIC